MKLRTVAWSLLIALAISAAAVAAVGWREGYRLYAVRTGSMAPTYPTGSVVLDAPAAGGTPRVGRVVTFRTSQGLVTHRVQQVTAAGLKTKGDNNRAADAWTVPLRNVRGVVVGGLPLAGYLLVFLQQPTGVPALMVLTVSVILAWSLFFGSTSAGPEPSASRVARESGVRRRTAYMARRRARPGARRSPARPPAVPSRGVAGSAVACAPRAGREPGAVQT